MKIKINLANNKAIIDALEKVNGKAESFTVSNAKQMIEIAAQAESKLEVMNKADRKGAKAMYRPAGPSANSYKYAAKSTRVYIERGSKDWFLVNVQTDHVRPKAKEILNVTISKAQADEIQARAISGFYVAG
jgi:hypothetical protein